MLEYILPSEPCVVWFWLNSLPVRCLILDLIAYFSIAYLSVVKFMIGCPWSPYWIPYTIVTFCCQLTYFAVSKQFVNWQDVLISSVCQLTNEQVLVGLSIDEKQNQFVNWQGISMLSRCQLINVYVFVGLSIDDKCSVYSLVHWEIIWPAPCALNRVFFAERAL